MRGQWMQIHGVNLAWTIVCANLGSECIHSFLENLPADLWVVRIKVEYFVANIDSFNIPLSLKVIEGELETNGCRGLMLEEPSLCSSGLSHLNSNLTLFISLFI